MADSPMRERLQQAHDDLNAVFGVGFDFARTNAQLVGLYLQVQAFHEAIDIFRTVMGRFNTAAERLIPILANMSR